LFGERVTDPAKWPIDRYSMICLASSQEVLAALEVQEKALEGEVARQLLPNEDMQRLLTVPGWGLIISATVYLEMGLVGRFPTIEKLTAYAGLVPTLL